MKPIYGLIFSKDRAMQLEATLASLALHCRDLDRLRLRVLYRASSPLHARQYQQLAQDYQAPWIRFVKEDIFRRQTLELLLPGGYMLAAKYFYRTAMRLSERIGQSSTWWVPRSQNDFVLFLVDDNLFVHDFCLADATSALAATPEAIGFSLRLGKNTQYCYTLDRPQPLPTFTVHGNGILLFRWADGEADFSYSLEVSSSIYRLRDIDPIIGKPDFRNPNQLEYYILAKSARLLERKLPALLCYDYSIAFCNPVNRVQEYAPNRAGSQPTYSSETLAEFFDQGMRIDVASYAGFRPTGCHQEVELRFRQLSTAKSRRSGRA